VRRLLYRVTITSKINRTPEQAEIGGELSTPSFMFNAFTNNPWGRRKIGVHSNNSERHNNKHRKTPTYKGGNGKTGERRWKNKTEKRSQLNVIAFSLTKVTFLCRGNEGRGELS
jgi:hypothetical protein